MKTKRVSSPGARLKRCWSEPQWLPPSSLLPEHSPRCNRKRVRLGAVDADEPVAQAVVAVRLEAAGEEMVGPGLVVEVVLDDAVPVAGAGGVQAHLQVLVVDVDVVVGELDEGEGGQPARHCAGVLDPDIPQLDVVVDRDEDRLLGLDAGVVGLELGVRETVPALVAGPVQRLCRPAAS